MLLNSLLFFIFIRKGKINKFRKNRIDKETTYEQTWELKGLNYNYFCFFLAALC